MTDVSEVSLEDKVRFLEDPASYEHRPKDVVAEETHMSWVFLAGDRVYKLKKPVRYAFLDFTSIAAREFDCREEERLNRRLAEAIYLGVAPLILGDDGRLRIGGKGRPVDWLVIMARLPRDRMLDSAILAGAVGQKDIVSVADRLAAFYERAQPADLAPADYVANFIEEHALNKRVLSDPAFALDGGRIEQISSFVDDILRNRADLLKERVEAGRIVEGHGDLRPEHVCLGDPPVIIDCLEFNRRLRLVDPIDELTYLGLECSRLGASWIGPVLLSRYAHHSGDAPAGDLVSFHRCYRACLRARLSLVHILERDPRKPEKWLPLARRYVELAEADALPPQPSSSALIEPSS
ncbi:hypothetical protein [Methylocapsa aurea]|uniref:hypothetical protein n=1 Tax=Methylocapsa aurea TaxID=663610 RepID=UPI00068F6E8E|nr:hypothetical protein [Methylocapsa aurea]